MFELATVATNIPFIGNCNQWLPASATIAAAYRVLVVGGDPRATDVEMWLSLPGHGGPGEAMTKRLNDLLVQQIRAEAYASPLKLRQLSYVIGKLEELSVIWAFGGSTTWPRTRIDERIDAVRDQVVEFIVPAGR